ncbi:MAG: DISARM system phospholipase D-like protein DrmC [Propionibacteriaceae bacterium]|jgi:phosphatidylserine/phosphatidylglycerophosphate/cardiolipin synthase-like enzyme|nr:DISARM system phospholipase D-like protein DrmC [Propionibacteriaceae bacterium]
MTAPGDAVRDLAAYLTGSEAKELADRLADGETASQALRVVGRARRDQTRRLLRTAGLGPAERDLTVAVLRAVEGAHAHPTAITPVWTAPGGLIQAGQLTASVHHLVSAARQSVVCSTYNFQRSSTLWKALSEVAARAEVNVRVYVDSDAADARPEPWKPSTREIATELAGAVVFRTRARPDGDRPRNHAKFIAIDHQFLLVTSANFSKSAEQLNVELGLRIDDPILTQGVENQMRALEADLYEPVPKEGPPANSTA